MSNDVLVVYGHVSFNIWSGKLQVKYGYPANGGVRQLNIDRGTNGLTHLVVLTNSGQMSFDSLKWLLNQDIAITFLDEFGTVLSSFVPEKHISPVVKRRQATAGWDVNKPLAVGLLKAKLQNQRQTLAWLRGTYQYMDWWTGERQKRIDRAKILSESRETGLLMCPDAESLRVLEAQAAAAYWHCFEGLPLLFKSPGKLPACWLTVGSRSSPKTGGPRRAVDPFNACLNYCYAVLETLVKQACISCGVDPDFGIFHADHANRTSLVFDLMEPLRPEVDRLLLEYSLCRKFNPKDFFETRDGVCKVSPAVTKEVIPLVGGLKKEVAAVVKEFAKAFKNKAVIQKPGWADTGPVKTKPDRQINDKPKPAEPAGETSGNKICPECGISFVPASIKHKFCCTRHKDTYQKRQRRMKRLSSSLCPQCGQPMPEAATGTYKPKLSYCPECVRYFRDRYSRGHTN